MKIHKVAFWSYSSHLKNKVLPSIKNSKNIKVVGIFSNNISVTKDSFFKNKKIWDNELSFLLDSNFDTVYISSPNSKHYKNSIKCLKFNKNVICEKPLSLSYQQSKYIIGLFNKKKKYIFEVFQYVFHPAFKKINQIIRKKTLGELVFINANFSVPINDKKNIRFSKKLGGGSLLDLGVYPLSIIFSLFDQPKINIIKSVMFFDKKLKIDLRGNSLIKIQNTIFNFQWGFNTAYKNNIELIGKKGNLLCEFFFAKKVNHSCKIDIVINNKKSSMKTSSANQINLAFNRYLNNSKKIKNNLNNFSIQLAKLTDKIKKESLKVKI